MQSRQTIIQFQANLILGAIIDAQDELEISDEDMPAILDYIQNLVGEARKRSLS
jgi:hypothetical protein